MTHYFDQEGYILPSVLLSVFLFVFLTVGVFTKNYLFDLCKNFTVCGQGRTD